MRATEHCAIFPSHSLFIRWRFRECNSRCSLMIFQRWSKSVADLHKVLVGDLQLALAHDKTVVVASVTALAT